MEQNLALIVFIGTAFEQTMPDRSLDQLDSAVVLQLQALGRDADCRAHVRWQSLDCQ
jgi:hypothetical protein